MLTKQELINFEKRIAARFDNGEIPYLTHFSGGNEDQLIEIFKKVKPGDWIFSTHRSHYHYLLAGGSPDRLEQLILDGKSMFVFDKELNFYSSSIVCATPSIAAGVAWSLKRLGSSNKVWCFIGDGAIDEGHFYEAAKYVDGRDLPCVFVIENNNRSVASTIHDRWGSGWGCSIQDFPCAEHYDYVPTYPHGGTGTAGWLNFKVEQKIEQQPNKQTYEFPEELDYPVKGTYKEMVITAMDMLAATGSIFIGYNVKYSSAYGTLLNVPEAQKLETPLAENLMAGLAIGMSLCGLRPVLYLERHDFIYNALDAIVNQIDKVETISGGQFKIPIIIRMVAGGVKPFYAGITHTSNIARVLKELLHFPVIEIERADQVMHAYSFAARYAGPVLISEKKELY